MYVKDLKYTEIFTSACEIIVDIFSLFFLHFPTHKEHVLIFINRRLKKKPLRRNNVGVGIVLLSFHPCG